MFWSMQQTFTEKDSMRKAWGPRQPLVTGVGGGWLYLWPVWRKPSSAYHPEARMRPFPGTNPERSSNLDLARSWSPEDMVGRCGRKLPDFAPGGATTQEPGHGSLRKRGMSKLQHHTSLATFFLNLTFVGHTECLQLTHQVILAHLTEAVTP